ncbi:nucleotidyltransferase [Nakamurella flava]|uniref:Nucleotidyltransferase n=1 Tax=Nakamurella flava TaxID=2576308 RepID=A0A4U6QB96_9ACTN|nr:nucleotidyltransferase [Nakamurella flava]
MPPGYDHPHASEAARRLAERGQILRVQVGSGVHGTAIGGQDDRDEMGICLEPAEFVTGLARVPAGVRAEAPPDGSGDDGAALGQPGTVAFEQYQRHTVWDRPGGLANRSGAGDLDVVVYSLRKWCRLALAGNPTVLLVLFVPDEEVVVRDTVGCELVENGHRFVSRLAGDRFLGYLASQRASMVGAGARTNRPELVAAHGYDTKFAMHALRLGFQGVELLRTGRITLPVPEPALGELRAVRRGEVPVEQVVRRIDDVAAELESLNRSPRVPDQPDRAWVDGFLHRAHLAYWADPDGDRFGS